MTSPAAGSVRWCFPLCCRRIFFPQFLPNPFNLRLEMTKKKPAIDPHYSELIWSMNLLLWMFHQMASTEFNRVWLDGISLCLSRQGCDWGSSITPSRTAYTSQLRERMVIISASITHGSAAELWLCNSLCLHKDTWGPSVLMGTTVAAYLQSACEEKKFCGKARKGKKRKRQSRYDCL